MVNGVPSPRRNSGARSRRVSTRATEQSYPIVDPVWHPPDVSVARDPRYLCPPTANAHCPFNWALPSDARIEVATVHDPPCYWVCLLGGCHPLDRGSTPGFGQAMGALQAPMTLAPERMSCVCRITTRTMVPMVLAESVAYGHAQDARDSVHKLGLERGDGNGSPHRSGLACHQRVIGGGSRRKDGEKWRGLLGLS
jgi:hypothetical protein